MQVAMVVPCYNESGRWNPDYWIELAATPGTTWLFVDDGSTDDTVAKLRATAARMGAEVLVQDRNAGKGEAVRAGLQHLLAGSPRPDVVGFLDADGAFGVDDVRVLRGYCDQRIGQNESDAVWSSRVALAGRDIRRSQFRHYVGRVVATVVGGGSEFLPYDTQSGLKFFAASEPLVAVLREPFRTRWFFEVEMMERWRRVVGAPMRIWEVPVQYWHDVPGSKLRTSSAATVLKELWIVKSTQRQRGGQLPAG